MTTKDSVAEKDVVELEKFGEYVIDQKIDRRFGSERLLVFKTGFNTYGYQRFHNEELKVEKVISANGILRLGILPVAPLHTPEKVGDHVMLKLLTPLVIDQQSEVHAYLTIPIEIGVMRTHANDTNMVDVFSVGLQYYAIYGTPENGILCRYHQTRVSAEVPKAQVYERAVVRLRFVNHTSKIVTVNRVVFPVSDVNFYFRGSEAYFHDLDMVVSERLGTPFAEIKRHKSSELGWSKTSFKQNFDTMYVMDRGF
jgi:hypothetical protein